MTGHRHTDSGGGFCGCGAARCSLPECDGWCPHPDGWLSAAEWSEIRRSSAAQVRQLHLAAPLVRLREPTLEDLVLYDGPGA